MIQSDQFVHSESEQGGYSKYYVLFGCAPHSVSKLCGILVSQPLKNLHKASEKLQEHFLGHGNSAPHAYHVAAYEAATAFTCYYGKKAVAC